MKNPSTPERRQLGELLLAIEAGKSIQTTERPASKTDLGVLKVSAVSWGEFKPEEAKAVHDGYEPEPHHRVRADDVLISRANTVELVGAVVQVDRDYPNRLLSDKTLRLVFDETKCDPGFMVQALRLPHARAHIEEHATGTSASMRNISQSTLRATPVLLPPLREQKLIAKRLKGLFDQLRCAREAVSQQLSEATTLPTTIILNSLTEGTTSKHGLGTVLAEVKLGIGKDWLNYPVLGATRAGVAPAKESPGMHPERYKPILPGTVFYNPMRILIGSIAFIDEDDAPGITSPDYVVLKGKPGVMDPRWFYYWLRSPLGERCIQSLARGAVRERMLFNRLAEGEIELPDFATQRRASQVLAQIKPMRNAMKNQIHELELLPQRVLARVFAN